MGEIVKCKKCKGTGANRAGRCVTCKGSGRVTVTTVAIEGGVQTVVTPAVK